MTRTEHNVSDGEAIALDTQDREDDVPLESSVDVSPSEKVEI